MRTQRAPLALTNWASSTERECTQMPTQSRETVVGLETSSVSLAKRKANTTRMAVNPRDKSLMRLRAFLNLPSPIIAAKIFMLYELQTASKVGLCRVCW